MNVRAIIPGAKTPGSGKGTENGNQYVDLGLPSGLKWATCNVGASNPQDYGKYFAWGETTGYTAAQVTSRVRAFSSAVYNAGSAASISTNLSPDDGNDAARANLGGNWRMPTNDEYRELIDNCTSTWIISYMGKGVAGRLFTSKTNGNSVFFPAAGTCFNSSVGNVGSDGYYWSASWYSASYACSLLFGSGVLYSSNYNRYNGQPVRGVLPPPAESTPVDLGLPSGLKWAAGNIGAKNPEDYGLYFAWGETTGYTAEQVTGGVRKFDYDPYHAGSAASISADLTLEQDAAHAYLGGNWRMPTIDECQELIDNCTSTMTDDYNGTGVSGYVFTSKTNGNSIFMPATGDCFDSSVLGQGSYGKCWSASWEDPEFAWYLVFGSGGVVTAPENRLYGISVRGVCK